jgi:hypothetical protein
MSIAADYLPLPCRGNFQKSSRTATATRLKKNLLLPRWYSKKCFDFQGCDLFELELFLLIDQIC